MKDLFTFSSNSIRLYWKEWVTVGIIILTIFYLTPVFWQKLELFNPTSDFRLPYNLSNDYWMFNRWCKVASQKYPIFIIGDSVVWGQYVKRDQTLSSYLNSIAGEALFANTGVDGLHPAAMCGLIKYYGRAISKKGVIVPLNPLWMTSKKIDLQEKEEFRFNHPRLVPLLFPRLPCYRPSLTERVGVIAERNIPFFSWITHIKTNYFDNMAIQNWTTANPYKNPLKAITLEIPVPEDKPKSKPVSWLEGGIKKQDFPWVKIEESLQWDFFKKTVKILKSRNNKVFVLLGPFNPYLMTPESLKEYYVFLDGIKRWLEQEKIDYFLAPALPSEYYADASHPVREGYSKIAEELFKDEVFKKWIKDLKAASIL